jgi:hypothetical protein
VDELTVKSGAHAAGVEDGELRAAGQLGEEPHRSRHLRVVEHDVAQADLGLHHRVAGHGRW